MQRSPDRVNVNGTKAKGDPFIRDAWTKLHVAPAKIMQVCTCMYMDMYTVYGYFYYCSKSVYCLSYRYVDEHPNAAHASGPTRKPCNTGGL